MRNIGNCALDEVGKGIAMVCFPKLIGMSIEETSIARCRFAAISGKTSRDSGCKVPFAATLSAARRRMTG